MTKHFLAAFLLLFPLFAVAQPDSCNIVLRFGGGYADTGTSNGAVSITGTRNWNLGLNVGLPLGKHWEAGIGFEYQRQRTSTLSELYIPKHYLVQQTAETKINLTIGKVYAAGHWQLFKRIYFNPVISTGIGKAKGRQTSYVAARPYIGYPDELILLDPSDRPALESTESDISYDLFAISLAPAFSFYLNRHFALHLEVGSFAFATTDWDWDNKQWLATVNPAYWQLGIIAAF